jgi:hypothetical protein
VDHHVFALAKLRKIIALFEKPFFRFVASFRLW